MTKKTNAQRALDCFKEYSVLTAKDVAEITAIEFVGDQIAPLYPIAWRALTDG